MPLGKILQIEGFSNGQKIRKPVEYFETPLKKAYDSLGKTLQTEEIERFIGNPET